MGTRLTILTVVLGVVLVLGVAGCAGGPDPLDAVRVESTRQAMAIEADRAALDLEREAFNLERERARAESVDAFLMAMPWVLLLAGAGACAIVAYWFLPIWAQKAGLVTRKAEDGETVLLMGKHRIALPLRMAGPYADLRPGAERAPLLAADAVTQERATLRQQAANVMLASQAAATVEARTRHGGDLNVVLPPEKREPVQTLPARVTRTGEPGLLPQISNEAVPPKLLEAITTQWEEVDETEV